MFVYKLNAQQQSPRRSEILENGYSLAYGFHISCSFQLVGPSPTDVVITTILASHSSHDFKHSVLEFLRWVNYEADGGEP